MNLKVLTSQIQKSLDSLTDTGYQLRGNAETNYQERMRDHVHAQLKAHEVGIQKRINDEFFSWGPLENLVGDTSVCEILVNGPGSIWFERAGELHRAPEEFLSDLTFRNIMDRLAHAAGVYPTAEHPIVDGHWGPFRLNLVREEIHQGNDILSLRRHPDNPWTLEKLQSQNWCGADESLLIQSWIETGKNFLVIGPTSSGKTSVLNACLAQLSFRERVVVLEDSSEIRTPNDVSLKLLTRRESQGTLPPVGLPDLLRTALRLRPDRIVIGEMRGAEAKDFLMALSSGHRGSLGTLHAETAGQALLRLEMLVQLGAPQWSVSAIRRLIHMSLDGILVTGRSSQGQRKFLGLYSISSLEETGFTLEKLDAAERGSGALTFAGS